MYIELYFYNQKYTGQKKRNTLIGGLKTVFQATECLKCSSHIIDEQKLRNIIFSSTVVVNKNYGNTLLISKK